VAILCSHCGAALPKEDSRFCNNCGTLVASHPFSPQSLAARKNPSDPASPVPLPAPAAVEGEKPVEKPKPIIREQIAQQPSARPAHELPDWVSKSEKEQYEAPGSPAIPPRTVGTEHVEKALSTMHELRVKVWEQKETISMIAVPETPALAKKPATLDEEAIEKFPTTQLSTPFPEQAIEAQDEEEDIEDRPTRLMAVPPSTNTNSGVIAPAKEPTPRSLNAALEQPALRQATPLPPVSPEIASPVAPAQSMRESYIDVLERADTLHLPAAQAPANFTPPAPVQPQPAPPAVQPVAPRSPALQSGPAYPISPPRSRAQRRLPFRIVSVLLFVLICIGVGTWIYLYQPFSIAPVTQPQQNFKDAALGVSLLYPNGWTAKVDHSKSTLYFADSSSTAQVTLTITNVGGDLNQYMQQQVTRLAMTGAKLGSPVTFAGTTWQQMQGTIQQSGANYTATLFVTMHGDHIVTLLQQAQQTVYPEEETAVFAPLRASLLLA